MNEYYKTSDLFLAVTISLWFPLDSIDKSNPNRAEFIFKRETKLDELVESYWRGEISVEPKQFASQIKIIKTRLYDHSI
jgi:hypothetical protein